jgi:hypothetical protein
MLCSTQSNQRASVCARQPIQLLATKRHQDAIVSSSEWARNTSWNIRICKGFQSSKDYMTARYKTHGKKNKFMWETCKDHSIKWDVSATMFLIVMDYVVTRQLGGKILLHNNLLDLAWKLGKCFRDKQPNSWPWINRQVKFRPYLC